MLKKLRKAMFVGTSRSFGFFERAFGLHISYPHFYSPLPTISELPEDIFRKLFSCTGVDFHPNEQKQLLSELKAFSKEYSPVQNIGLSLVDAFVLYSLIRKHKPKVMVEIGSGESTRIALQALVKNREEGFDFKFTAVEPYPPSHLFQLNIPGFELKVQKVQEVPLDYFKDADILFIDSSHVSKIGSDVNYEILEILPKMKSGSLIHWHDIVFPQEYPENWIRSGQQFWNESYMLQAFLSFNSAFKIIWASKYLQTFENKLLETEFPFYTSKHNLTSLWVKRIT